MKLDNAIALGLTVILLACGARATAQPRVLDATHYHLGLVGKPEWEWFEGKTPSSNRLDLHFTGTENETEATLFIRQEDVKFEWVVQLNGRKLGTLFQMEQPLIHTISVPAALLKDGDNVLTVLPPALIDDIIISEISLDLRPMHEALAQTKLQVRVTDKTTQEGLPCRITIVDERRNLVAIYGLPGQTLAVRPGVVYTADGQARLGLLPGKYTVYATRGFEYGLDQRTVLLPARTS